MVINERDIMVDLDNKYILSLQHAFETKHFVVLSLECTKTFIQIVQGDNSSIIYER